jgi:glyoxylase-like metal-dependent hydrolase (beta-lactamase superfamily II)
MYKIRILKNADWFAPGTVIYDHGHGRHDPVKICLVFFLIEGHGHTIVVDGGMDGIDRTYTDAHRQQWNHLNPSRDSGDLLREAGVALEQVDTVIYTHLHFDHYWNAELFTNARFFVPRKDWFYLMDPANLPYTPPSGFPRKPLAYLAGEAFERLALTDDGQEVLPGITLHWTGGHSPGHQVVRVPTAAGEVIIVGDVIYLYENLECNIPIGYYTSADEVNRAMRWLRQQNAILLPAHDYEIFKRHPSLTIG